MWQDTATSWECSYVQSNGTGMNLHGKLDVDDKRARFVATAGLFGNACGAPRAHDLSTPLQHDSRSIQHDFRSTSAPLRRWELG